MAERKVITLEINGRRHELAVTANRTLLDALRQLGYVDVKNGCEKADCGACAVLLDDRAIDSCITLARLADGRAVTTVAGLGDANNPHPLQTAFIETGATQCGYCIPGILIAAKALLDEIPDPTDADIRTGLSGNLCRCTGYVRIFNAIHAAAATLRADEATA